MRRRRFLQCLAGLSVTAITDFRRLPRPAEPIAIVGGGILGASVAYHLSRRGARVMLFEKERPAAGATGKSFAWINAHYSKQPRHYSQLNYLGVLTYRQLEQELRGALGVQWGGCLEWYGGSERARELRQEIQRQQEWGYAARLVDAEEFGSLEPHVQPGPLLAAAYTEQDGMVDAVRATLLLLKQAQAAGAEVLYPCEVTGIEIRAGRVRAVETTQGSFPAHVLVIAGGVDTARLASLAGLSVPLVHSPGILIHTAPLTRLIGRVLVAAEAHLKQYRDGRMVIGDDYAPPPDASHTRLAGGPQDFPDEGIREIHGRRILRQAETYVSQLADARLERITIGWRPMPEDGHPIVGFAAECPNLYLAVTHSGVTLGALLGRLAAMEILDGVRVDLLDPYRPSRFRAG